MNSASWPLAKTAGTDGMAGAELVVASGKTTTIIHHKTKKRVNIRYLTAIGLLHM
ncbi:hypothetical protein VSK91_05350 [Bacillus swezeyi]|uniref:hypothetical protein n=1 Tax=Bacillus swezeyi TaxID=1925020 RepID=UPI0039C6D21F